MSEWTVELRRGDRVWRADLAHGIDISLPVGFTQERVSAFGLPPATATAVEAGGFVGSVDRGGPVDCFEVTLHPHGDGTHTECSRHVTGGPFSLTRLGALPPLMPTLLVTVPVEPLGASGDEYGPGKPDDDCVSRRNLQTALDAWPGLALDAIAIRTLPNVPSKRRRSWSGTNPPYVTSDAMLRLRQLDARHLLVDLPSVDREDDGGELVAHHIWWHLDEPEPGSEDEIPVSERTITELIYVPDAVPDGLYLLSLAIPSFELDAAPSRPVLFRVEP